MKFMESVKYTTEDSKTRSLSFYVCNGNAECIRTHLGEEDLTIRSWRYFSIDEYDWLREQIDKGDIKPRHLDGILNNPEEEPCEPGGRLCYRIPETTNELGISHRVINID